VKSPFALLDLDKSLTKLNQLEDFLVQKQGSHIHSFVRLNAATATATSFAVEQFVKNQRPFGRSSLSVYLL
jgi:hypothetical protein